jgi:CelD/BcsL family acetyltransferase involved in cellulose biosynthesis
MNGVAVRAVGEEARQAWDEYVARHEHASPYHRWAWRHLFGKVFGYRSFYLVAEDARGEVVGCLPLFLVGPPFARRLVAVPFRDRGGPLWNVPAAFTAIVGEARRIQASLGARSLELKSVQPYPAELVAAAGLNEHLYWVGSVVDLRNLGREAYLEQIGPKTRNMLKQAERAGLEFAAIDDPASAARVFYALHLATQRSLGLPPFPRRFFERLLGLGAPGGVRLNVVRQGARPVAAALLLLEGKTAIYGYSASDPSAQELRPNDWLLFHSICALAEQGFSSFDMGSDAPAQEGLLFFKKKWRATQAPIPVYSAGAVDHAASDSSSPRYAIARRLFRRLPLILLRATGELTRLFG